LGRALLARDPRQRAIQRRLAPEADQYLAEVAQRFATDGVWEETLNDLRRELTPWEEAATGNYLTRELSAVDLTVYPFMALLLRRPQ
jgi:hypothetical protein